MKVGTPLGEYPFQFRRVERRGDEVAFVGLVAGLESSVVLGPEDFHQVMRVIRPYLVGTALLLALRHLARRL